LEEGNEPPLFVKEELRVNVAILFAYSGNDAEAKAQFSKLLRTFPGAERGFLSVGNHPHSQSSSHNWQWRIGNLKRNVTAA
jgi:hypothetical protein